MFWRMTIETEEKWRERVRKWRASGKTAKDFAADQDFEASTLRFWASRLKEGAAAGGAGGKAASAGTPSMAMVRVVRHRRPGPASAGDRTAESSIAITVSGARITIAPGFDEVLLRQVVAALGGGE